MPGDRYGVVVDLRELSTPAARRIIGAANSLLGAVEAVATMTRLPDEILPRVLADAANNLRAELEKVGAVPLRGGTSQ